MAVKIANGHKIPFVCNLLKWPLNLNLMATKYVYQTAIKYNKWPQNIPNGLKVYLMVVEY
jgi:hypothetical protein